MLSEGEVLLIGTAVCGLVLLSMFLCVVSINYCAAVWKSRRVGDSSAATEHRMPTVDITPIANLADIHIDSVDPVEAVAGPATEMTDLRRGMPWHREWLDMDETDGSKPGGKHVRFAKGEGRWKSIHEVTYQDGEMPRRHSIA